MTTLRRSRRFTSVLYDSNGRDYLSATIGCSRQELEEWLASPSVHPHLLQWYHICIESGRRFNDAVGWINTGDKGYFYNPDDLEEDLLLACLGEGNMWDSEAGMSVYASSKSITTDWCTQELWARTAWRIAQNNADPGTVFRKMLERHPVPVYAFVIDILCIAFHSIAFRGEDSVWVAIIKGAQTRRDVPRSTLPTIDNPMSEIELDLPSNGEDDLQDSSSLASTELDNTISNGIADRMSDDNFVSQDGSATSVDTKHNHVSDKQANDTLPSSKQGSIKDWVQSLPTPQNLPYRGHDLKG